ncbi:MAG: hypothetical protein PHS86_10210, partial [Syntrophaceae bacterium]|nr:hypothetical protein [Syntrophaceae bacterium]
MLLKVNKKTRLLEKETGSQLKAFGLEERDLQGILFNYLERIFPEDELLMIMQSRKWQEEPDLMAVDKNGHLFIFELKQWESQNLNLLQVLRYGQLFGASKYDDLDALYQRVTNPSSSLKVAHEAKFGSNLVEEMFNQKQVFVVMTNGLDYKTREAIQYWRSCGLDIRPWVYRLYPGKSANDFLIEMSVFRVDDNPYEDIAQGYYLLNTNFRNNPIDHNDMLSNHKAAAYFDPWKKKIERLSKGDFVFLYQSGVGIVALGSTDGKLIKAMYQGDPIHPEEEYYMTLLNFKTVAPPLTASEIKQLTGVGTAFRQTMCGLNADDGKTILNCLMNNGRL